MLIEILLTLSVLWCRMQSLLFLIHLMSQALLRIFGGQGKINILILFFQTTGSSFMELIVLPLDMLWMVLTPVCFVSFATTLDHTINHVIGNYGVYTLFFLS